MANILANGLNIGTELVAVTFIYGPNNQNVLNAEQLGHLTSIGPKSELTKVISSPVIYGGKRLHRNIYHDFSGMMEWDRFNGNLTNLFLNIMANAQATGAETYFNLYWLANNTDTNSQSEYLASMAVLDEHDPGKWTSKGEVPMTLGFRCQTLQEVGAAGNLLVAPPAAGTIQ